MRPLTYRPSIRWSLLIVAISTLVATLVPMSAMANGGNNFCFDVLIVYNDGTPTFDETNYGCPEGIGMEALINGVTVHLSCSEDLRLTHDNIERYSIQRYGPQGQQQASCGVVEPDAPTKTVTCGSPDKVTVPAETAWVEYVIGSTEVSGTEIVGPRSEFTIEAVAKTGSAVIGTTSWTFTLADAVACPSQTVTPTAPTIVAADCDSDGYVTIPTTTGVIYRVGDSTEDRSGDTIPAPASGTITAVADEGYQLAQGATTSWNFNVTEATGDCPLTTVTPTAPTIVAADCDSDGYVVIPTTTGVEYHIDQSSEDRSGDTIPAPASGTITAVADEGYQLAQGATTSWNFNVTEATGNCPRTPTPTPDPDPDPEPEPEVLFAGAAAECDEATDETLVSFGFHGQDTGADTVTFALLHEGDAVADVTVDLLGGIGEASLVWPAELEDVASLDWRITSGEVERSGEVDNRNCAEVEGVIIEEPEQPAPAPAPTTPEPAPVVQPDTLPVTGLDAGQLLLLALALAIAGAISLRVSRRHGEA